jgi:hypothetical protein
VHRRHDYRVAVVDAETVCDLLVERSLHAVATDLVDFVHGPDESEIGFLAGTAGIDADYV